MVKKIIAIVLTAALLVQGFGFNGPLSICAAQPQEDNGQFVAEEENRIQQFESLDEIAEQVSEAAGDTILEVGSASKTLMVKVNPNTDIQPLNTKEVSRYGDLYVLTYENEQDAEAAYQEFSNNPDIEYVEKDSVVEVSNTDIEYLQAGRIEENIIDDTEAMNVSSTNKETIVAIIDTGIKVSEGGLLEERVLDTGLNYSNSGENNSACDDNGHGTGIATLIAAATDKHVKLLPMKAANKDGKATVLSVYMAIQSAYEQQADVINLSMNASAIADTSKLLESIINDMSEQGVQVVVSAGNSSKDVNEIVPANIDSAIVVSAVDEYQEFAGYSNYGETVDYCALGTYQGKEGTSYAAARVTGIIANMLSSGIQSKHIEEELDELAIDLGETGKDTFFGTGLLIAVGDKFSEKENESGSSEPENPSEPNDSEYEKEGPSGKYILKEDIIKLDWRNLSVEELDTYLINSDIYYVGYLLNSLNDMEREEIKQKSNVLNSEVTCSVMELNSDGLLYNTVTEKKGTLYEQALAKYQEDIGLLSTSEWYIESGGVFYISSDDRNKVYKYSLSSLNKVTKIDTIYQGLTPLKSAGTITITRTRVRNVSSSTSFTAPEVDSIKVVPTDARCHEYVFTPTDTSKYETYTWNKGYSHIAQGNDDGWISRDLYVNFKNYSQTKTGYHTAYNDVDIYAWNASKDDDTNFASKTAAKFYDFETLSDDGKTKILVSKKSDAISGDQSIGDKELVAGKLKVYYNGVYKSGKSYSASNEATWSRSYLASESSKEESCNRAMGAHTISDTSSKFTLLLDLTKSCGIVTFSADENQKVYEADIPNYVMRLVVNTSTLTVNPNGGTWGGKTAAQSFTQNYNTTQAIANPTIANYTATFMTNDGTNGSSKKTTNRTFSSWSESATFTAGALNGTTFTYGSTNGGKGTLKATYSGNYNITLPSAARTGYTFDGWYDASSGGTKIGLANATIELAANTTLYAHWVINSSTLKVDPSGGTWNGSTALQPFTGNYNTTKVISNPAYIGHIFTGWSQSGTNGSLSGTTFTYGSANGTTTILTAGWKETKYTVKYDRNDGTSLNEIGTGTMDDVGYTYNEEKKLSKNAFERAYYNFIGWNTKKDGSGAAYVDEELVKKLAATEGAIVTLYAQWERKLFNVAYSGNGQTNGTNMLEYNIWQGDTYIFRPNVFERVETETRTAKSGETYEVEQKYGFQGWEVVARQSDDTIVQSGEITPASEFYNHAKSRNAISASVSEQGKRYEEMKPLTPVSTMVQSLYMAFAGSTLAKEYINLNAIWNAYPTIVVEPIPDADEDDKPRIENNIPYFYEGEEPTKKELISYLTVMDKEDGNLLNQVKIKKIVYSNGAYTIATGLPKQGYTVEWEDDMPAEYIFDTYYLEMEKDEVLTHMVTYEVTDSAGNTTTAVLPVQVKYNYYPEIKAKGDYYTFYYYKEEANRSLITAEELIGRLEAIDREDGDLIKDKINLVDFNPQELMMQTNSIADFEILTKVTDRFKKTTYRTITVEIVDDFALEAEDLKYYTRFISLKYMDTLEPTSTWRESENWAYLKSVLENETPIDTWYFTHEDISKIKAWILEDGDGHWKIGQEANREFLRKFGYCRQTTNKNK